MPKVFVPERGSFQITSTELTCRYNTPYISVQESDSNLNYINTSDKLGFLLREYDERSIVYAIVLEFFEQTGGVF